jgi:hypothetical protein
VATRIAIADTVLDRPLHSKLKLKGPLRRKERKHSPYRQVTTMAPRRNMPKRSGPVAT